MAVQDHIPELPNVGRTSGLVHDENRSHRQWSSGKSEESKNPNERDSVSVDVDVGLNAVVN